MASETMAALVKKLEESERMIDSLHAVRDRLEIEREQVESLLIQGALLFGLLMIELQWFDREWVMSAERNSRVESEKYRRDLEERLAELREVTQMIL